MQPGRSYLAKLLAAGFRDARLLRPTGVAASSATAAFLLRADA